MNIMFRTCFLVLFASLIVACNVIPEPEQVRVYPLYLAPVTATEQTFSGTLRVAEPSALNALDTARIAVYQLDGRQAYWQGVRLQDRVPLVVQDHLLQALQTSGVIEHVTDDRSGSAFHFELHTHIEAFGLQAAEPELANVVLRAQLRGGYDRQVVATRHFEVQSVVEDNQATSRLSVPELLALARSLQAVQQEIITWLESNLDNRAHEID